MLILRKFKSAFNFVLSILSLSLLSLILSFYRLPFLSISATPLRGSSIDIHPNARWQEKALTVAGGNGQGNGINQLSNAYGLYVDDDQAVYIADMSNHRIIKWKSNLTSGQVVAGGNGQGSGAHQLSSPLDVIVDKQRDNLIICDSSNSRVIRWPRRNGTRGETIIANISCCGLTMDENGFLYVTDVQQDEVRRYRIGESEGTVVAGGNGKGNRLDQLSSPRYAFVDRDHSVYVSDEGNDRVMKWVEDVKHGIVVAGGRGEGNGLTQLSNPWGVVVDQLGTVYIADIGNDRIMRWPTGGMEGSVIAGGNGGGGQSNQLRLPISLSFDQHCNLYVADYGNHRVQKFNIDSNA
jgi:sugar lactone lactonase YvrE